MTKRCLLRFPWLIFLVLTLTLVFSVSAMVNIQSPASAPTPVATTTTAAAEAHVTHAAIIGAAVPNGTSISEKSTVNAIISPEPHFVGDSITISGIMTGQDLSKGLRVWNVGGATVNISAVRVNTDGSFSKTFQTKDLLPGKYSIIVVNPGPDDVFDIGLQQSGGYSDIVDANTGAVLVNLTGNGNTPYSVNAQNFADTVKKFSKDDVYTDLTYQLAGPVGSITSPETIASTPGSTATSAQGTPLPEGISLAAVAIAIIGATWFRKD
jgi:hypothetical protein